CNSFRNSQNKMGNEMIAPITAPEIIKLACVMAFICPTAMIGGGLGLCGVVRVVCWLMRRKL
ncbi:unnamed protein product, partial [marine sediment metagenome]